MFCLLFFYSSNSIFSCFLIIHFYKINCLYKISIYYMKLSKNFKILSSYGFSHAVIDFVCASVVMSIYARWFLKWIPMFYAILIYNILAFWLQALFWHLVDKYKCPKLSALLWCGFVALWTILLYFCPWAAVICVWIGNALFHVWGGVICISTNPEKATPSWIFVAPWALGLFFGIMLGKSGNFVWWYGIVLLLVSVVFMWLSSKDHNTYNIVKQFAEKQKNNQIKLKNIIIGIVLLLLISIVIRSFVWFIVSYSWKVWLFAIMFTASIVLWKFFWWIIADKFGRIRVWVLSLILSLPCLLLGEQSIICWMVWIFLFNITMSIALAALIKAMPNRWWLAFWLLCMALLVWALPSLLGINFDDIKNILLIVLIGISSVVLYVSLEKLNIKK